MGWILSSAMLVSGILPVNAMAAEPEEAAAGQPALRIWYDSPATDWESEASPLGTGSWEPWCLAAWTAIRF